MDKFMCYENTESIIDSITENGGEINRVVTYQICLNAGNPNLNPYWTR